MMRFGVVACSACRRVQTAELRFRTVRCTGCRAPIDLARARFFHRGDNEVDARHATMRVSAQLQGMGIEDLARLVVALDEERVGTIDQAVARFALRAEFSADELRGAMEELRVPGQPDRVLAALIEDNRVFEPRPGRYRIVA